MTMVHVHTGKGKLHVVQINPANVLMVSSPVEGYKGDKNTIINLTHGEGTMVIEPRDVVFALIGNAAMDKRANPGYFHAVKGVGEDEWNIRRVDYETE